MVDVDIDCEINSTGEIVACMLFPGLIAASTALISGSIVLAGNTIHWLEKQGKCDNSFVQSYLNKHNKPLLENNGKIVELKKPSD